MARTTQRKSKKAIEGARADRIPSDSTTLNVPAVKNKYTVLRSPHVDKKSREQIEIRANRLLLDSLHLAQDALMKLGPGDVVPDLVEYAKIFLHAVDTFGSRTNANAWLNKPNRVFHNQTPLQILTEDPAAVEEELVRIDHGMFI